MTSAPRNKDNNLDTLWWVGGTGEWRMICYIHIHTVVDDVLWATLQKRGDCDHPYIHPSRTLTPPLLQAVAFSPSPSLSVRLLWSALHIESLNHPTGMPLDPMSRQYQQSHTNRNPVVRITSYGSEGGGGQGPGATDNPYRRTASLSSNRLSIPSLYPSVSPPQTSNSPYIPRTTASVVGGRFYRFGPGARDYSNIGGSITIVYPRRNTSKRPKVGRFWNVFRLISWLAYNMFYIYVHPHSFVYIKIYSIIKHVCNIIWFQTNA